MTAGPGKYDDITTEVRERTKAKAVIVIVLGGDRGQGFSVQSEDPMLVLALPELLEEITKQMRADIKNLTDLIGATANDRPN